MSDKVIENNQVSVIGEIVSGFTFSHEVFGEGFYMVDVLVRRLSDSADVIPVMISERLINVEEDYTGEFIRVAGQFRSYNRHEEKKNRLVLSVLPGRWNSWKKKWKMRKPIRFFWTVISVKLRYTGRRLSAGRSRIS